MSRKIVVAVSFVVFMVGMFAFSQWQPERLTASTLEKAHTVQQKLDQQDVQVAQAEKAPAAQPAPAVAAPAEQKEQKEAPAPAEKAAAAKDANVYKVKFDCSNGSFVVEVHRDWAPLAAARFEELVKEGFYNDNRFFRVVPGFVVQFGLSGDPAVNAKWRTNTIKDEKATQSNTAGMVTFAKGGPNSRTTQIFVNLGNDNTFLDSMGFPPFGKVVEGMDVVKAINSQYGEQPNQQMIQMQGNAYLNQAFPKLDFVRSAKIVE